MVCSQFTLALFVVIGAGTVKRSSEADGLLIESLYDELYCTASGVQVVSLLSNWSSIAAPPLPIRVKAFLSVSASSLPAG